MPDSGCQDPTKDERDFSERNALVPDLNCNEWIDKM